MLLGIAASALYLHSAELRAAVPDDQLDALIPNLILLHLPQGVRAVVIAAILAAAMSSIDSGLNSLSAATVRDFIERGRELPERQLFVMSKVTTVVWGVVITAFAFATGYQTGAALLKLSRNGEGVRAEEVYFLPADTFQNHHGGLILLDGYIYTGTGHNRGLSVECSLGDRRSCLGSGKK